MLIKSIQTAERQMETAVRNQVNAAKAGVRRDTSIVRTVSSLMGTAVHRMGQIPAKQKPEKRREGVYKQSRPDGYQRRSPVQEIQIEPGYRCRYIKRAVLFAILAVALAAAAMFLGVL